MLLDGADASLLKKWIIRKLEDISDADSDVLADYVVALVNTEDSGPAARAECARNLKDFVPVNTDRFVDELFQTITTKSYDPSQPILKAATAVFQPLNGVGAPPPGQPTQSKKRSYWEREEQANSYKRLHEFENGSRPIKQARRGGRGREQRGGRYAQPLPPAQQLPLSHAPARPLPRLPFLPPDMPPFDPANPMPAFMAMAQAFESFYNGPNAVPSSMQRCRNMEVTGACADGLSCPYDHSSEFWNQPSSDMEYDPSNAVFPDFKRTHIGQLDVSGRPRGRGRRSGIVRGVGDWRGGNKRSKFAQLGFNHDTSVTTIVLESIPDGKCNEEDIRGFFSEFGVIAEVALRPEQDLALVKFGDHAAAQAAYNSPKVVFDNRFVKVYMKKSEKHTTPSIGLRETEKAVEMGGDDSFDVGAFAKRQDEAQRKHEEIVKQREEAVKQKQEVSTRLVEMELQRRQLEALLAKKTGKSDSPLEHGSHEEPEQTKALKAQLAQLEAEAKSMGIDPDAASMGGYSNGFSNGHSGFRGRGGYRGRGRGRGRAPYRGYGGGWGGSGIRGAAVMRLDNRPKTVAVKFSSGTYDDHDEAIRQFLLFNSLDSATITKYPDQEDSALVSFHQRFQGENFMLAATNSELPHIGKIEMSWYAEKTRTTPSVINTSKDAAEDNVMTTGTPDPPSSITAEPEGAYDVADEDLDRWS